MLGYGSPGVAGTDELERNVNCWIAAKRYLID